MPGNSHRQVIWARHNKVAFEGASLGSKWRGGPRRTDGECNEGYETHAGRRDAQSR